MVVYSLPALSYLLHRYSRVAGKIWKLPVEGKECKISGYLKNILQTDSLPICKLASCLFSRLNIIDT